MPSSAGREIVRRGWYWAGQAVLAVVLGWFVWRTLSSNWSDFRALQVPSHIRFEWIGLAALLVWTSYGVLIIAWRTVLAGWGQALPLPAAIRIWCLSNLGRYLPGKVWSLAGLVVLARGEGVEGWAAAGAALVMQAIAMGTGVAVVVAAAPNAATPLALGVAGLAAVASALALTARPVMQVLERVSRGKIKLQPLSPGTVATAAVATLLGWILYGLAFRLLAMGLTPDAVPSVFLSVGVFASGYIVGLIAVFAPGGVGVREGVFVVLLTPTIGAGAALVLSVGSRVLLTLTEVGAALAALAAKGKPKETVLDRTD